MKLVAIKKDIPKNSLALREIITQKRLLKTKLKLLNIYYFDKDLKTLHTNNLDLSSLSLDDFFLTQDSQLIAPLFNRIIPYQDAKNSLISSHLIYLSYLYNYDFYNLYNTDNKACLTLINSLILPEDLKASLLTNTLPQYFNSYLKDLNTHSFNTILEKDKKRLLTLN